MKKLTLLALAAALALPAFPGAAQVPTSLPTPGATATPTATATAVPAATTAPAEPTQIFAARTATRGVSLTIAGQGLLTGITTTRIASDSTEECAGVACATAAGAAEPLGTTVSAQSPGEGNPAPVEAGNLEPLAAALAGRFGAASAMTTPMPSAEGSADGLTLDVTLNQTILGNLPPELTEGLNGAIGQLAEGLQPIADGDPTGAVGGLLDTLTGLTGDLTNSPLLRIQGAQSTSSSSISEAGVLSATAASEGVIIVLLPTPESTPLLPEGLAVIEVGSSSASASADGVNPATADARASIARVTLLPGILDALPDIDPGNAEGLPLEDILGLLPPQLIEVLPAPIAEALGLGGEPSGDPTAEPTPAGTETEGGPTGTPLDDILPVGAFMQADSDSGGFVINLSTGTEQTCFLEDTPLATCVTLGGTSETFSEDGLGVGVLAAGVDVSLIRDETGVGQVELSVARSEAGAAAEFVQAPVVPTPTPTPQTGMPATGGSGGMVVPALAMMALGGTALFGLRRRREG